MGNTICIAEMINIHHTRKRLEREQKMGTYQYNSLATQSRIRSRKNNQIKNWTKTSDVRNTT